MMIVAIIYLVIGFWMGLRSISNSDDNDTLAIIITVLCGLLWPITVTIGIIAIISEKMRKA